MSNDLQFESQVHQDGFTQIQNCVLRSPKLSMQAKTLFAQILSYAWFGTGFPGRERLAKENDVHVNSIDLYMNELKKLGLIEVKRRGMGLTNLYTIKNITPAIYTALSPYRFEKNSESQYIVSQESQQVVSQESQQVVSQESQQVVSQESQQVVNKEYEVKKDKGKEYEVKKHKPSTDVDLSLFEKLWKSYPKKVEKKKAVAAYTKAIKKGVTHETIAAGLDHYLKYLALNEWRKAADGGRWFANDRWTDEYDLTPPQQNNSRPPASNSVPVHWKDFKPTFE